MPGNYLTYVIYSGSHWCYWIPGNSPPLRACRQPSYHQNLLPDQSNEHSNCFPASQLGFKKHCLAHLITSPKVLCLAGNLAEPTLGLEPETFSTLIAETTHIIHCAWTINFVLPLPSFLTDLAGLQNLLVLSLSTTSRPESAKLIFCPSVAATLGTFYSPGVFAGQFNGIRKEQIRS